MKYFKNLILMLFVIAVVLFALELGSRYLVSKNILQSVNIEDYRYQFDPVLGWSIEPNSKGRHKRLEYDYTFNNNSFGMRYKEFSKAKSIVLYRIAVLGDSFTWGFISDPERFTDQVESLSDNKVEMLNFGLSGYSPIQYYLMMDEIAKYKPDAVLIAFCLLNDFANNVLWNQYGVYKPYADIDSNGNLEIKGYPLPDRFAYHASSLYKEERFYLIHRVKLLFRQFGATRYDKIEQRGLIGLNEVDFYTEQPQNMEQVNEAIAINTLLLQKIKEKCDANGIRLIVMEIPTKQEYDGGQVNYMAHNALMQTLEELKIDRIELIDDITIEDFYTYDGHWQNSGHRKAAGKIFEFLTVQGILK